MRIHRKEAHVIPKFVTDLVIRLAAISICSLFIFSIGTLAGPPLVCHMFDIGNAKSLPWTSHDWNLTGTETYNTRNLSFDTIAILNSDPTVIVHMETLRRATLYARKDPLAAKELFTKLMARADAPGDSAQVALAIFDAGYLAEAYKQWIGKDEPNPARGLDGYALVKKAISTRNNDAQMQFAAALIALQVHADDQQAHAANAIAGAKNDPLLAKNLAAPFHGPHDQSMAEFVSTNQQTKTAARQ
jgi:hypothetical protein